MFYFIYFIGDNLHQCNVFISNENVKPNKFSSTAIFYIQFYK